MNLILELNCDENHLTTHIHKCIYEIEIRAKYIISYFTQ